MTAPSRRRGRPPKAPQQPLTILGLDPGLSFFGYAVADIDLASRKIIRTRELGTLKTERDTHAQIRRTSDDLRRARCLHRDLSAVVDRHAINVAACEMVSTSPHARPSHAFGIMLGLVASFDFYLIELLPAQIKSAVAGNRHAPKDAIIRWALEVTAKDPVSWPTSARQNRMDLTYRAKHVTAQASHQADALAAIQAALGTSQLDDAMALQKALKVA